MTSKAILLLGSLSLLSSATRVMDFDREVFGKTPAGWSTATSNTGAPSRWEIRKDSSAPTQPYVLAQVSEDPAAGRMPLAIWDGGVLRDADVSVRLRSISGSNARGGGLVWRYRDASNYYFVRADALENTVAVYRLEGGRLSRLGPAVKHPLPANEWRILKVAARGRQFQIYVDHRRILRGEDSVFAAAGKVGVFTMGDAVTHFDDFRVDPK
jgi:hypothetical protein